MKVIAAIVFAAVLTSGCVTRIVEVEEGESVELQVTRASATPTTSPPSTAPPTTARPVTVPPATVRNSSATYTADLDYISGYCFSDCNRTYPATWERYLDLSTSDGLAAAVATMADMYYYEIDSLCLTFWEQTDSAVVNKAVNNYGISDTNAMMATFYYVCDT
tara:strand:- start:1172 stop:1660 length:489 start_codon:yes stop_codon:yes gene_type:complete